MYVYSGCLLDTRAGKVLDRQGAVIYEWFSYQLVYFFRRQICFASRPCWLLAPQDDVILFSGNERAPTQLTRATY